jgi:hypothetical protein
VFVLRVIKKFIAWEYQRGSWQHEFLCLAYIAALIFIPTNSNGWFVEERPVELGDGSRITLHRVDTTLFLTWEKDTGEPDSKALQRFVAKLFGEDTELIRDNDLGPRHFRIIPRGLK